MTGERSTSGFVSKLFSINSIGDWILELASAYSTETFRVRSTKVLLSLSFLESAAICSIEGSQKIGWLHWEETVAMSPMIMI